VRIPVSLFHQDYRLLTKVAMVAGMAQQHELSFTKVHMSIVTFWMSKLTRWENWTLDKALFLRLIWQQLGGRLTMKGQWLVLTEMDTSSAYKFVFPADTASAQSITCEVTQCLTYPHGIASGRRHPFPANEGGNGPCSWIHHLTYSSPSLFLN
jgi:hypothetical protein